MDFNYLVPEDARLSARISQRSNLKYMSKVLEIFDERQRQDFRASSLGFLADVADIQFSAQLLQQFVFRNIHTEKKHELWFNVQGHYLRFGLQEYALVTGLHCGVPPDDDRFHRVLEKSRLKDKYFKSLDKISCAQLEKTCARSTTPRADRYKLGLALIVEGIFKAPDNNVGIDVETLSLVDDLDVFFAYPWGRVGYSRLIKGFGGSWARKFQDAKKRQEKEITYTVHGFPIAMQIWAYEAIPEIGTHFGKRIAERSPRLLCWTATKQSQLRTYNAFFKRVRLHVYATLRPTELERNENYISTLVPFDDEPVPALDNIATTVVDAQFEADDELSGGDGYAERDSPEEPVRGAGNSERDSDEEPVREPPSATEQDESSSNDTGDGHAGAQSVSGSAERPEVHHQGGRMGAQSDPTQEEYIRDYAPATSRHRGVQSGVGLSRSDVEGMLFEQRVLIEMRLRTVKLEIFEHVTGEFARLREFISTLVRPSVSPHSAAPHDVHTDTVPSSFPSRDENGGDLDQHAALDSGRRDDLDTLQHDVNIVPGGDMGPEVHGIQIDDAPTTSGALDVGVPEEDMGPEVDGIQIDDAPTTSGKLDVGGDPIEHDDDLELPDAVDVRAVPTRRRRSSRLRMPAASTRTPYTRGTRRTKKK